MPSIEARIQSASVDIRAAAAEIFELIADPARQSEWDGNNNLAHVVEGARIRSVGDVFTMRLTNGKTRENRIVEFSEGRLIAWNPNEPGKPAPGHLWRWELEPLGERSTRVTHTYDWTRLTDESRFETARSTTSERLRASISRLASLVE